MAIFTIQAPDGRKIKIEAADEAIALRGAQEWAEANPGPAHLTGKVAAKGSTGEVSQNVRGLNPEQAYQFALDRVQRKYYPGVDRGALESTFDPYEAMDMLNAGLTFGFNDETAGAAGALSSAMRGADIGEAYGDFTNLERARQELGAKQQGGLGVAAEITGALLGGRPDMAASRVAGFLPTVREGVKGGMAGGAAYGLGSSDADDLAGRVHDATEGALTGGALGAAVPAAVAAGKRVISPMNIPQAKGNAAAILRREGVDLTAGQASGNQNLRFREAELGGAAAENFMERQAEQFTAATLRRAGITSNRATPDVVDRGFDAIGQQFDDLAARNSIVPDNALMGDLSTVWRDYAGVISQSNRAPVVENTIRDLIAEIRTGSISGEFYKSLRSRIERLARGTKDSDLAITLREIKSTLDDAMERSISQANPNDLGAWQEVRRLYRNMLVVEDAIGRAGAQAADGIISPAALKSAAMRKGKRAFLRGNSEFTELANAGVSTMTPLPNSGTAGRLNAKSFLPIGAGTGATIGGLVAGIPGAAAGAVAGAAVPWVAGRALLSGAGRRYLTNQRAAGPTSGQAAVIGALLGRGSQPLLAGHSQ